MRCALHFRPETVKRTSYHTSRGLVRCFFVLFSRSRLHIVTRVARYFAMVWLTALRNTDLYARGTAMIPSRHSASFLRVLSLSSPFTFSLCSF